MTKAEIKAEQKGLDKRSKRYRELSKMLAVFEDNKTVSEDVEVENVKGKGGIVDFNKDISKHLEKLDELIDPIEHNNKVVDTQENVDSVKTIDGYYALLEGLTQYAADLKATNTDKRLDPVIGRLYQFTLRPIKAQCKDLKRYLNGK